jgi:hypothetical protein
VLLVYITSVIVVGAHRINDTYRESFLLSRYTRRVELVVQSPFLSLDGAILSSTGKVLLPQAFAPVVRCDPGVGKSGERTTPHIRRRRCTDTSFSKMLPRTRRDPRCEQTLNENFRQFRNATRTTSHGQSALFMMASNRSMLLQESDGVKICIDSTVIPSPDSPANWCPLHLVRMWVLTAWRAWVYSGTRCGI